jgi:hypothetical protein
VWNGKVEECCVDAEAEINWPCSVTPTCCVECSSRLSYGLGLQVFAITFKHLLRVPVAVLLHCTVHHCTRKESDKATVTMQSISRLLCTH